MMEFEPMWTGCFGMTDEEFYALVAPFVAAYGLMLAIGLRGLVHRHPARLLRLSHRGRGR